GTVREKVVGKKITKDKFKDFYYTYATTVNPPEYQRYRFYVEGGKTFFYHEKREGNNTFLTEEDITVCGTKELSSEEWDKFWNLIDGGSVRKRKESADSGNSGPWLYLYWEGDKNTWQEFSFKEYEDMQEFEEFCKGLVESVLEDEADLKEDSITEAESDDMAVLKEDVRNLNAYIKSVNKLAEDELKRLVVGYMSIDYIEIDDDSKELCPNLAKSLDEFNDTRKKDFDESSVRFVEAANKYAEQSFEAAEVADTCMDYEFINVMRADNVAMSMLISYVDFWGHGDVESMYVGTTYDSQTGKKLEITDVVKDLDKYKNAIENELKRKYENVNIIDIDPEDYLGWVLTPEGIIVYFVEDYVSVPDGGDTFIQINFDEYPGVLNEKYSVAPDEYAIQFWGNDIFYMDTEGAEGEREAVVYSPKLYGEETSKDEYSSYAIYVDDKCYSNNDEDWFYGYKPYYVHTKEGSFIYTYVAGYEQDYITVNKFYGEEPVCIETLPGTPFLAKNLDDEDGAVVSQYIAFTNPSMIYDALSFENNVCGTYKGDEGDGWEERYWDISSIDGKYYLDYIGEYDYSAAEIELLDTKPFLVGDELRYMVKVYPFSGFAFGGEYQGGGEVMYISSKIGIPGRRIELSADNPFFYGTQSMYEVEGVSLHKVQDKRKENNVAPEIIGGWRSIVAIEGMETNIFVQFLEDGSVDIVRKCECYPPDVFRGIYSVEKSGDKYIGKIEAEGLGMGSQPMVDWILEFDLTSDNPITIKDEFLDGTPLAYGVDDLVLEKAESGVYDRYIHPGPYDRTDEVVERYDEYIMSDEDFYYDFQPEYVEAIINTAMDLAKGTSYISYGIQDNKKGGEIWIKVLKDVYPSVQATVNWVRFDMGDLNYYDIYDNLLEEE
ncbi:MAG: hypothetical protein Q4D29_10485, partial [Lachnospiraceae bacterium]|nr:hypothetical protein [Lachnospiraceae bacterium]